MKKKNNYLTLIALVMLLVITVGATYAYFAAQKGSGGSAQIEVGAGTTDSLTFKAGVPINITASSDDFYQSAGDKTGSTTATAKLVPNNTTNDATDYYNVYFIIDENDFTYSTEPNDVELLLKVTDPDGEAVTNIEALAYNETLQGFDITKRHGAFKVVYKDEIKASNADGIEEIWNFEVTLRNLEADQQKNTGKTFSGKVLITTDEKETYVMPEINSIVETTKDYKSITVNLLENEKHTEAIDKYYYAIEETTEEPEMAKIMSIVEKLEPTYVETTEATHVFTECDGTPLKDNQSYKIYAYSRDIQGISSNIKTAIIKTDEYKRIQITNVSESEVTHNSFKVIATASDGANPVKEYAFKIEDNETYGDWSIWQASPEFTFSGLKAGISYNVQVKARDTLDKETTNSYDKNITTTPFTVTVQVTGGTSTPPSTTVAENGTATFAIAASAGYDVTSARVSSGDGCILNVDRTTLTVSDVTSDKTCTVEIYKTQSLNQFIISKVNTNVGLGTLAKHDTSLANSAQDNSYRYSGNNPNNFVCFGSGSEDYIYGESECPDTNLYRIIGVFNNQVKLIKSEYIKSTELGIPKDGKPTTGSYDTLKRVKVTPSEGFYWNNTRDNNTWESSTLYQALNNNESGYLSKLGTTWKNKIATTTWHVGGYSSNWVTPKGMYDEEIKSTPTVSAQIGLMYASDYGFASASSSWTELIDSSGYATDTNRQNNWLYNKVNEWTISRDSSGSDSAFCVYFVGYVHYNYVFSNGAYGVRPVFYLNTDVKIKVDDAIGDVDHPFRIVV